MGVNMIKRLSQIIEKDIKIAVGLMSGTSLDGIDAALVEISGSGLDTKARLLDFVTLPYDNEEKSNILELCSPVTSSVDKLCRMNKHLGRRMAQAALEVMRKAGMGKGTADFVSSHGQTVCHMPDAYATLQLGELAEIAAITGCITVGDFRPSDMAAGGQGAPLVPFADYLLFADPHKGRALVNIGGISNVTVISAGSPPTEVLAFDTGPGNMLIDAVIRSGTGGKEHFDRDGEHAAKGNVCSEWLDEMMNSDVFIGKKPPKSTGREYYGAEMAERLMSEGMRRELRFEDIAATVTAYTVSAIRKNFEEFIDKSYDIRQVLVGGGGSHNRTMMKLLASGLRQEVLPMEALCFNSDAKEAVAFALLGNEFLHGSYNNLPSATGASRQVVMGKLALP